MDSLYIHNINHNRYLKLNYLNSYKYSKLIDIKLNIKFKKNLNNNKFNILCIFFLFKTLIYKNGFILILNKRNKKILGFKFILKNNIMFNFLKKLVIYFISQPEIQNNIKYRSFDSNNNYILSLVNSNYYYFEKLLINYYFKNVLYFFDMILIFNFKSTLNIFDNLFYLNFYKFYFIISKL